MLKGLVKNHKEAVKNMQDDLAEELLTDINNEKIKYIKDKKDEQ